MSKLEEIIQKFRQEIPHFIATDVVNIETGLSVAGGSVDPDFDASVAAACYAEVTKSNKQALDLLGLGGHTTEDILVSTREAYLLLRLIGNDHFHGLAITKHGALGYARSVMKKYEPKLLEAINQDFGVRSGS
jgi:predicted regulator of Ras-like GTPase activity (Roadblock/LC7/MglB family)